VQPLRHYQEQFVTDFCEGWTTYGALEQGLGKSRAAIEIVKRKKYKKVLIVCPTSVLLTWVSEITKWMPGARYFIPKSHREVEFKSHHTVFTLVTYGRLSRGTLFVSSLLDHKPYDFLIIDEAHYCKTANTQRTRAVAQLTKVCERVLPLSGTPIPNHYGEIYPILRMLAPHLVGGMSLQQFEDRFCKVDMKWFNGRLRRQITGSRNGEQFKALLAPFMTRLKKKDCLPELPALQFVKVPLGVSAPTSMAATEDLSQMSDEDFLRRLNSDGEHFASLLQQIGLAKTEKAIEYLNEFLEDNDRKIVVWAKHHSVIDALMIGLKAHKPARIDGRCSMKERGIAVDRFLTQDNCRVFIGQINAAGTGLTLLNDKVQPTDIFFVESDFVPGNNLQSACRTHRLGMRDGCLARIFVAHGVSLDQRVQDIIDRKMQEIAEVL
jgi:SWI/SNF-related matrix-associated actin-dependent regulator 1 of chromatin subfamily A